MPQRSVLGKQCAALVLRRGARAKVATLRGPQVDGGSLGDVPQIDVTPTILALLNVPVADDLPGSSWVKENVARVATYDHLAPNHDGGEGATNAERLQQLGYID